ncbi:unnamed protein product [Paramecium primaurelia]|uniref:Uncharacterized protein n=1 Tax=Paramecium primaurelia TaxID=5886 RepID=A0A8S1MS54_PARPR|nr:unnamed protein product [Paramecium primaurelia]
MNDRDNVYTIIHFRISKKKYHNNIERSIEVLIEKQNISIQILKQMPREQSQEQNMYSILLV